MASSRKRKAVEDDAIPPDTPAPEIEQQHSSPAQAKPNAFTELMKPKPKMDPGRLGERTYLKADEASKAVARKDPWRDGLAEYTMDPERFPRSRVIYFDKKFVVINDMYPKSSVHLLVLPRDRKKNVQQGQQAFDDLDFLAECKAMCKKVEGIVAEELRRRYGKYSKTEQARIEAMESDEPLPAHELPKGRDWHEFVKSGIHAKPSMNHLHIHVMSTDMVSEPLRSMHHYHSFQDKQFFMDLEQFPLESWDPRRSPATTNMAQGNLRCWRPECGREFGNQVKKLKEHLEEELDAWKRE